MIEIVEEEGNGMRIVDRMGMGIVGRGWGEKGGARVEVGVFLGGGGQGRGGYTSPQYL